jgi:putative ABC transport system permease protein
LNLVIYRKLSLGAFRLGMLAFPAAQRQTFGAEAAAAFEHELCSRFGARGRLSSLAFVLAATVDAAHAGIGERLRLRRVAADSHGFIDGPRRARGGRAARMGMSWLDVKLGFRMLRRYPGLTVASALALAIAIGVGAGWYDLSGDFFRPRLPLPDGDRIVEVEMRSTIASDEERRILHDFLGWRDDLRSVEDLSAYRSINRNLIIGDAQPEAVTVAEMTASAFQLTRTPPLLGRLLSPEDEHPGAPPVLVIGHGLWQHRFDQRTDVIGQTVRLGRTTATIVGVMPEGYAFPVNHRAWMPLRIQPAGYGPLEGVPVRVFGRVAPDATQGQVNVELEGLVDRTRAASPATHEHLRPRVLAYGGESPGDRGVLEFVMRHLPILLVLLVACANVGTLIYARTATREGEIATRYALGASRGRIIGQLFVEALVLASIAAVVGLVIANWAIKWGVSTYYSGAPGGMPFWMDPGLKASTVIFASLLTIAAAALLGILPGLKATRRGVQSELRNLGTGGATLRFGKVWTAVMIAQVALTVLCLPPAYGISQEALRDRAIRGAFPAEEYLAVRIGLDGDAADTASGEETNDAHTARINQVYRELERRLSQEPGVRMVAFGDRMPGVAPAVRRAEVEVSPGSAPRTIFNLWSAGVGPRYFEAFGSPIVAGRDFQEGDRTTGARTVIVNEAFVRRYLDGASPVGRRVRYASADPANPEPWFEIVGVVRDIGMTPTDLGEAPYIFRAVTPGTAYPLVAAVRIGGDPVGLSSRIRVLAAELDPGLRLDDVRVLEDVVWRADVPAVIGAGAIAFVVALGLFLSSAGIFSLMSVNVARRTREIGLRCALGASPRRLLAGIFSRALVLIGSGILAGNALLIFFIALEEEASLVDVWDALVWTSLIMLATGLLACVEPARRALRIQPTDALKEA